MPRDPNPAERLFRYAGFRCGVRAADPSTLEWLEEFYRPWYAAGPASDRNDTPIIELHVDPAALRSIVNAAEATGREADVFTLDKAPERWSLLRLDESEEIAHDPTRNLVLRVRDDAGGRRRIDLLAETERPFARLVLLRLLRELAAEHATGRGALPVHASAVALGDRVTIFVGAKQAGKSTLLLHALGSTGTARYVSNDRVFVRSEHGSATAIGMPTVVTLREGSLATWPGLREELASGAWHHSWTVEQSRAHRARGTVAEGFGLRWPPGLSAAQLCTLIGLEPAAGGVLERIVFPRVAEPKASGRRFEVGRLGPDEAAARLLDSGLIAGGRAAGFLRQSPPPGRGELEAAVRELADGVACLSCVLGPGAYDPPSVWDAIVATG